MSRFLKTTFSDEDRTQKVFAPLRDVFRSPDLRNVLPGLALAAFLHNALGLALPMAILQIMDRVVANQSIETLVLLAIGILACLVLEELLRAVNSLVTGWLGARLRACGERQCPPPV